MIISDLSPLIFKLSTQPLICSAALSNNPLVAHSGSKALERLGILMNSTKDGRADLSKLS